uniref:NEDD8-activating enzyme E1 catalytic subunit n=1 Tax=Panagrolaimus superbus TaxID=310955 RepID=A0A914YYT3_9BILA
MKNGSILDNFDAIQQCKVLVVGSGGLGCEILKGLALSGFKHIETIDMDTIDLSNLNRQFLFRESDIGQSKAEVAARFVNNRVNDVQVIAHNCKIQDKDLNFYRQFSIVICGLDSIVARRWLNATMKPFGDEPIDGDSPEHLTWIMERALERAKEFNITGVDFRLTQGVVKRIIPAVASTNAIIAGSCVLEALKLASNIGCPLDNYLTFSNINGAYFAKVR